MNKKKKTGRPRLSEDERVVPKSVTFLESHLAYLEQLGGGNRSRGVRIVTDEHMRKYWPINKICPDCEFWVDETCTDMAGYIHSQTGNSVCRYNPFAVLPKKEHDVLFEAIKSEE